ncbi:MAG: hypothetical protein HY328_03750 [Chloroflexi bacterium]|nr:hypothetical protein [Chloroflexota bacterium]
MNTSRASRILPIAQHILPWVAFVGFMAWGWGLRDIFRTVPHYGDALENIVSATWFSDALTQGQNPLIYPYNYFPEGWRVGSHSVGALLYLLLVPLVRIGGGAFAYNIAMLLTCIGGFAGALLLARRHLPALPAAVVSLAITFWSMRWGDAMEGRLNIFMAAALLPWMLWAAERACDALALQRRVGWLVLTAIAWALAFNFTLYFVFLGGVTLALWMLFGKGSVLVTWPQRLLALSFAVIVFLLLGAPWLALNLRESALVDPPFYAIGEVNFWGASLNSFPIPFLYHPWLASLARSLYRGEPWEQGTGNLGMLWSVMALIGVVVARRNKGWLPALAVAFVSLCLALGLTLHWDGRPLQWSALEPLNQALWQIGHRLKPDFFVETQAPASFAEAVPLPALLLTIFLPFWERGRVFARYALAANLGVYLLAGMALAEAQRWRPRVPQMGRAVQWILAGLLLFEIAPPPLKTLPFPPPAHPAYTWLSQQSIPGEGIANVFAAHSSTLVLSNHGYNLLSPSYTKQATVAGAAGVRPRHTDVLNEWLATHEHPFWQPDFAQILRSYRVRYVVMEMLGEWETGLWQEAQAAEEIQPLDCFPAPPGTSPWDWPICILEVLPGRSPEFNLLLHDGWSGQEEWGVWAEGTRSDAQFIATARAPFRLEIAAFPLCVPGKNQRITLAVNGAAVAEHKWRDCEPWNVAVDIPAELMRVGFNDLTLRSAYAETPQAGGSDPRKLSVGFSRLRVSVKP